MRICLLADRCRVTLEDMLTWLDTLPLPYLLLAAGVVWVGVEVLAVRCRR